MKKIALIAMTGTLTITALANAGDLYHVKNQNAMTCNEKKITAEINYDVKHPGSLSEKTFMDIANEGKCAPWSPQVAFEVLRFETFSIPAGVQKVAYGALAMAGSATSYFYVMKDDIEKISNNSALTPPGTYKYDNSIVRLSGTIITATADPSKTIDGKSTKFAAIKLLKPIDVLGDADDQYAVSISDVRVIQLAISGTKPWSIYQNNIGRSATVNCQLYPQMNAHHFTPVLCSTKSIVLDLTNPTKLNIDSTAAEAGCHFKTVNAIVCTTPRSAALASQKFGEDTSLTDVSYNRELLREAGCGRPYGKNYAKIQISQINSGRIATPNGWVEVASINSNKADLWYVARKYLVGVCEKYKPFDSNSSADTANPSLPPRIHYPMPTAATP